MLLRYPTAFMAPKCSTQSGIWSVVSANQFPFILSLGLVRLGVLVSEDSMNSNALAAHAVERLLSRALVRPWFFIYHTIAVMSGSASSAVQQVVPQAPSHVQCEGVNRRGGRCSRLVALGSPGFQSIGTVLPCLCRIHHRIALNSQAPPRVLPFGALQQYLGS